MLVRRGKTYYSRLWVPVDLREQFGCKELVRSLHTTDRKTAKAAAKVLEGETETLYQVMRSGMLTSSQINSMIERHRERKLEGLSAARRQHGPKVYLPPVLQSVPEEQLIAEVVKFHSIKQRKLEACVQLNQYKEVQDTAEELLTEFQLTEPTESPDYRLLCEYLLKAEHHISGEIIKRMNGASIAAKIDVPAATLKELFDHYRTNRLTRNKWNTRTEENYSRFINEATGIIRNLPLTSYRSEHAVMLLEALKKAGNEVSTASSKVGFVSTLFKFAEKESKSDERWRVNGNPFSDMQIETTAADKTPERPYTCEDLIALLSGLLKIRKYAEPHRFWVPLIALYTGMRQGEITQLRTADIEVVSSSLAIIHVRHRPDFKQKTKNKRDRTVPIHPELKRLGLLQYLDRVRQSKQDRLFPLLTWTAGKDWSSKIRTWWNETFQKGLLSDTTGKSFHSLRKNFIDQFKQSRVYIKASDREVVQSMVGHEGMDDVTSQHYEGKFPPETQYKILCKLNYGLPPELIKQLRDKEY